MKTASVNSRQRTGDNRGAPGGGWLVNRVLCAVLGHRRLFETAAAEKLLPSGARRQLSFCHACGSYAWKATDKHYSFSWDELGV
jgi:hypothetical protein